MQIVKRWPIGCSLFTGPSSGKGEERYSSPAKYPMVAVWDPPRAAEKPQVCTVRASLNKGPKVNISCSPEQVWAMCNKIGNILHTWKGTIMRLLLLSLLNFVTQHSVISKVCRGGHLLYMRCEIMTTATAALVDSGATQSFISARLARKLRLRLVPRVGGSMGLELADGMISHCTHIFPRVRLKMGGPHGGASHRMHATLHVLEGLTEDIILGKHWLEQEDPQ
eukprot:scaffold249276_cov19-Tisochrysis_lutea.AAC.1